MPTIVTMDWEFVLKVALVFTAGAICFGIGVSGLHKGRIVDRAGYRYRQETPIMFILTVAAWTGLGAFLLIVSFGAMLGF